MLILDFDGVLIDSVDEVAVSAINTIQGRLITRREELPENYLETFRSNRFAARRGADMPHLAKWCLENPLAQISRQSFAAFVDRNGDSSKQIEQEFFQTRNHFVETAREAWLALNAPYYPLWNSIQKKDPRELVVLTNKNRQAVLDIGAYFGVRFQAGNVFSGDGATSKEENFDAIQNQFPSERYTFVDDSIENLHRISPFNTASKKVELCLASWGYVGPGDSKEAEQDGFQVISQESLVLLMSKCHSAVSP